MNEIKRDSRLSKLNEQTEKIEDIYNEFDYRQKLTQTEDIEFISKLKKRVSRVVFASLVVFLTIIAFAAYFLIFKNNEIDWHAFAVVFTVSTSAFVATLAMILRGAFPKKSEISDLPNSVIIKAVESVFDKK